jgi:DNA polymerase-3 subunit alpha
MAVFTLEDLRTSIEVMVFPRSMTEHGHKLADDAVVVLKARVDKREDTPKLIVQGVEIVEVSAGDAEPLRVRVPPQLLSEHTVGQLKQLLVDHPGDSPVFLHLGERQVLRLPSRWNANTDNGLIGHLRVLLGPSSILVSA